MKKSRQEGITLTLLVIAVIVILIIAGTSLAMIFDYSGILRSSKEIKNTQENYANSVDQKTNELIDILDEEMNQ